MKIFILKILILLAIVFVTCFGWQFPVFAYKEEDLIKLVDTKQCVQCDLSNLKKLSSKKIDLNKANLQKANGIMTDFSGLSLNEVNFSNAKLIDANLSQVTAVRINLKEAQLNRANLSNSVLQQAAILLLYSQL